MRKLKMTRKLRKASAYKKAIILFVLIMLLISMLCIAYVFNTMIVYERSIVDNYIEYLASSGELTKDLDDNLFEVSKLEKKNTKIKDGIKKILKSKDLKIVKNNSESQDKIYVYDLKVNGDKIAKVSLKNTDSYTRMAILTINEWEVADTETYFENGIYAYEITIPDNYKLYVNGNEVDKEYISENNSSKELERMSEYIKIASSNTYTIDNLVNEPDIEIKDDKDKNVEFKKESKINVTKNYKEVSYDEMKMNMKEDFDVLALAEKWSLFLTDDLQGRLNSLKPYLIDKSYMYQMAYGWATQVDITFVSNHTLKKPTFTNEKVSNCIIYSDEAFSCEVTLEKNMVVRGEDKVDKMHDRLYFVYYDGGYKLVNMESK